MKTIAMIALSLIAGTAWAGHPAAQQAPVQQAQQNSPVQQAQQAAPVQQQASATAQQNAGNINNNEAGAEQQEIPAHILRLIAQRNAQQQAPAPQNEAMQSSQAQ